MSAQSAQSAQSDQTDSADQTDESALPALPAPAVPRPEVEAPEPWEFPASSTTRLANGLTVVAYDVPGQYVISLRLAVPAPLAAEPREVEGVAGIMSRTLDEGSQRHSGEELAELLERKGIALGAGMAETGLVVDVDVAQRHLGAALELLTECVAEPSFPADEVSRHVKTRLAEIDHERAMAGTRAALEFVATFFDPSERASRPAGGTKTSVGAITAGDVAAFHAEHVHPGGATLVVAGDLTGLDLPGELERTITTWPKKATASARTAAPAGGSREKRVFEAAPPPNLRVPQPGSSTTRIVFVDRPGSVQSELYVGTRGPDRRVEGGWAPYPVVGFVLGGSPGARIDAVLREEKGFTYGIRAGFRPRHEGGLFLATGSVRADATAEGLGLLLDVLDGALSGFTAHEAKSGVDFIGKTAPGRYATADAIADEAVMLSLEGLSTDFTTANLRDLLTVDAARLGAAYARFVTGAWTVVLVGDASRYAEPVRALGRGEVTVVPS